jgi:hypothetical protein
MTQTDIRQAVAAIKEKFKLSDAAIKIDHMYSDSVIIQFEIRRSNPSHGAAIRETFEGLCRRHGWQAPRIEVAPPTPPDWMGWYEVDLRKRGSLSKSAGSLPE